MRSDIRLDFFNCDFKFLYNKFMFKIQDFSINSVNHNCVQDNIYNDWITIYLDKIIDIEKLKLNDIYQIEYNKDDHSLIINDESYNLHYEEFGFFVGDFHADLNQAMENIMKYFCEWFMKHIDEF